MLVPSLVLQGSSGGEYLVGKELGRGALGNVFVGEEIKTQTPVIIKIIDKEKINTPGVINRIYRDITISERLNCHPGLICLLDTGEDKYHIFLISEYTGPHAITLEDWRVPEHILNPQNQLTILHVLSDIASAVEFMHSKNIAHRDIKPENIILKDGLTPILIDFDLACVIDSSDVDLVCKTGFIGTPYYMAPEVLSQKQNIDYKKADIYSLGVTFYFLSNGKSLPYNAQTLPQLKNLVLKKPPIISQSPITDLNPLIMRMIERDPRERPNAIEVKNILLQILDRRESISGEFSLGSPFENKAPLLAAATSSRGRYT